MLKQSDFHMDRDESSCPPGLWIGGQFQKWAIGVAELVQPRGIFRLPKSLRPERQWFVLTIDDAPSSRTDEILAILRKHSVQCSFFIHTDQINSPVREQAMERLVDQGHEVAHHMPANLAYGRRTTATQFREDFGKAHDRITKYGEAFRPWFRPPMGVYHHQRMGSTLTEFGYEPPLQHVGNNRTHWMASFAPWDSTGATNTPDAQHNRRVANRYATQLVASLYPGCIVVFHDGEEDRNEARLAATLTSLESFLRKAKANGWTICSLGQAVP